MSAQRQPLAFGDALWRVLLGLLFGLCLLANTPAQAQAPARDFDHLRTGFALSGAHTHTRCESCHLGGVFKGTPRDCASCHTAGARFAKANVVKGAEHIPTQQTCESCHSSRTFVGARMNHAAMGGSSCSSCHNGVQAPGKPTNHLRTSATCDSCHNSTGWRPASGFDHGGVAPGTCASCHNGSQATGKSASHTPYTQVGSLASVACDSCHRAGFRSWTPAKLHSSVNVSGQCSTCHAASKPSSTVHIGQTVCENCHRSTATWSGAKVDHSGFNAATACGTCHSGSGASGATGKPSNHVPVGTTNCAACHGTSNWRPSRFNHTQVPVTAQCASCHTGTFAPADGKPASHTPYQLVAASASANCDTCHKAGFTAWTPAKLHTSVTVAAQCATCHAAAKPSSAVHVGQTVCESCHRSTSTWAGARVDHNSFTAATNCSSCHSGTGSATGKASNHIPVGTTNCASCHTTSNWKPSRFNHTQVPVTAQCSSCHTGTFPPADGKGAAHTPYQLVAASAAANCDTCHKAGYASWTPAKLHSNVSMATQCATCHASSKPNNATHLGQTQCESCHRSTATWTGARVDHSTFTAATVCSSCHNGSGATGKAANHIPVGTTNCASCHTTGSWKPSRFNHTQVPVTAQCASCHTGSYAPADGKPAQHIPYQLVAAAANANCDTCHRGGYASWANGRLHANVSVGGQCKTCHSGSYASQGAVGKPANHIPEAQLQGGAAMECNSCHTGTASWAQRMNHNGSLGGGAGWCKACHASGTNFAGGMERKSLTHEVKNTTANDCSSSGCHRPLGNKGTPYTRWE